MPAKKERPPPEDRRRRASGGDKKNKKTKTSPEKGKQSKPTKEQQKKKGNDKKDGKGGGGGRPPPKRKQVGPEPRLDYVDERKGARPKSPPRKDDRAREQHPKDAGYSRSDDYDKPRGYAQSSDYDNSRVYDEARDYDNSRVYDRASDYDDPQGYDRSGGYDNPAAYDRASDYDNSRGYDRASDYDNSRGYDHSGGYDNPAASDRANEYSNSREYDRSNGHSPYNSEAARRSPPPNKELEYVDETRPGAGTLRDSADGPGRRPARTGTWTGPSRSQPVDVRPELLLRRRTTTSGQGFSDPDLRRRFYGIDLAAVFDSETAAEAPTGGRRQPTKKAKVKKAQRRKKKKTRDKTEEELDIERHERHLRRTWSSDVEKQASIRRTELLSSPTKKLTGFKKWKYERSKEWKKSKANAKEALANFTIWNGAFKAIEGRFGSPVLAYFRFLKWLFLLDLLLAILMLSVVVLPQVLMAPADFDQYLTGRENDNNFRGLYANQSRSCSSEYEDYVDQVKRNNTIIESILDFIQGTGWMERTPVFMGFYFNRTYTNIITDQTVYYNMSTGYLLAIVFYFLISLFLMVRYTAKGVKSRITSTSDQFYKACNKVFCGWDFSLSEKKAVVFKHNQLYQEYIRDIDVQRRKEKQKQQTRAKKCQLISIRIFINMVVLAILGASGYLIYHMANESIRWLTLESISTNPFLKLLVEFLPSLTVTVLNFLVPLIFQKLVLAEGYSPTLEIKVTIFRSVTLRLASVAVLVIGVGGRILSCNRDDCNRCEEITGRRARCFFKEKKDQYIVDLTAKCWETYFGQQFYKLVLLDFFTVVLMTFLVQFPRKFIVKRFENKKLFQLIGYQEFEIPKEVLDIVYSQTLCWIGSFVSPIILCMTVLKMFFFFYIKKIALLNTCDPSTRLFRASNSQSFFMSILLLSFVLCAIPVAFAVGKILPSKSCGPFRIYSSEEYYMFHAMTDTVSTWPQWLQSVIQLLTSWTFYIPLIVVICLVIYFYVSVAAGKRRHIEILLTQLALEGKDKQYLLTQVRQAIARGDFKKD